jgi:hypothetical protein
MFCIHYVLIHFYQETNLIECKHNVKQKMTSFFQAWQSDMRMFLGAVINLTKSASSVVDVLMRILRQQETGAATEKGRETVDSRNVSIDSWNRLQSIVNENSWCLTAK